MILLITVSQLLKCSFQSCVYLRKSNDADNNHTAYSTRQSVKRSSVYRISIICCYMKFFKSSNLVALKRTFNFNFAFFQGNYYLSWLED